MLLFFASLALGIRPVILIPGTYASLLKLNGTNLDSEWYCPRRIDDQIIWIDEAFFLPPFYNCLLDWATVYYDKENDRQASYPGASIYTWDFGELYGITYLDRMGHYSFLPYYSHLIHLFEDRGWKEHQSLFGAPFDWRFGMANLDHAKFWDQLKELVEKAWRLNNERVVLLGHSLGGYVLHMFLNEKCDEDWLAKYVERGILVAPSFSGAGKALRYAWTNQIQESIITISGDKVKQALQSMGAVHIHFPNYDLFGNATVVVGPDGKNYTASAVPDLLVKYGKVQGDNVNLVNLNRPYLEYAPRGPKVPEYVMFNSAIETEIGLKVLDNWENGTIEKMLGSGDSTLSGTPIYEWCKRHESNKNLVCYDVNSTDPITSHFGMIKNEGTMEILYQAVVNDTLTAPPLTKPRQSVRFEKM